MLSAISLSSASVFFSSSRVSPSSLAASSMAELGRPGLQRAVARHLVVLDGLRTTDQDRISRVGIAEVLEVFFHLGGDALHGLAGLGTCRLADDLEHLLQALDLMRALLGVGLERLLQLVVLGRLGGFLERLHGLLLGVIDVLQRFVEGVVECLLFGRHEDRSPEMDASARRCLSAPDGAKAKDVITNRDSRNAPCRCRFLPDRRVLPRRAGPRDFVAAGTGEALRFRPATHKQDARTRAPEPMSILRTYFRTLGLLRQDSGVAALLVAANIALAVAQFAEPMLFGRIVDKLTSVDTAARAQSWSAILPLGAAWAGFGLFVIGCAVVVALHADRLAHRNRLATMARFFEHVLHLPLSFHAGTHSGRLLKIMLEGANGMAGLWLSFFRDHCAAFVSLLVLMPVSLVVNWRLGALLVGLVVVFGALTTAVLRRTEGMQGRVEAYQSAFAERAADALGNVPVIQSFARIEAESAAMRSLIDRLLAVQLPVLSWWALAAVATRASATLTILAIFALGLSLHFQGLASVGQIVAFMSFATMMIARLDQAVAFANALLLQAPKLRDFFAVLDTAPAVHDRPGARDPGRLHGRVVFEGIAFSYDGVRDAVADIALTVEPGQTIALVGATGSGKSTTLALLHRVFDPTRGRITIDGIDLRDMTLPALRRNIGVVFQEPMLFARSIEENLRIGAPEASAAVLATALERAQAADFVARQPEGLATLVGERGRSLSGGERQRLAIARALLKDPPILILDEATSALDPATERKVQRALEAARAARTTFVIAHRLSTIRHADRVLVFEGGRIVESGTYETLVARGGVFAALVGAGGAEERVAL